jgi:hypothetical protein
MIVLVGPLAMGIVLVALRELAVLLSSVLSLVWFIEARRLSRDPARDQGPCR